MESNLLKLLPVIEVQIAIKLFLLDFPTIAPPCASAKEALREERNWPPLIRDFSSAVASDRPSDGNYNASVNPHLPRMLLLAELMRERGLAVAGGCPEWFEVVWGSVYFTLKMEFEL